jgi:hypothetical protein
VKAERQEKGRIVAQQMSRTRAEEFLCGGGGVEMFFAASQRLLLTFHDCLAPSVEQDVPKVQDGGCSLLPVPTKICGDWYGE